MRDIVDRLKEIADLKSGDPLPKGFFGLDGSWAWGMSILLYNAITEIETLREDNTRMKSKGE